MDLSLFDWELTIIIFTAIVSVLMGAIVFLRDRSSSTTRSFLALTIIISTWTLTNYFSLHSPTPQETLFWIRAVMVVTSFLGPTLFFFLHTYPKRKLNVHPVVAVLLLGFACLVSVISSTPLLFSAVTIVDGNITPVPGPLFPLYLLVFLPPIFVGFVSLIRKYRKSTGKIKTQIRYLFLGSSITFSLLIFTNLIVAIFIKSSSLVFLGPVFSLIMLGAISYAIIKHRLLNISGLIARTASYSLLLLIISIFYALIFYATVYVLFPSLFKDQLYTIIFSTTLALLISFTLPSIQTFVEHITDRFLYKNKYDPKKLFDRIAEIITSTFELEVLSQKTTETLQKELRVTSAQVVLLSDGDYIFFQSSGTTSKAITASDMKRLPPIASQFIIFDELDEGIIKDWMTEFELGIIHTLEVKNEIIGYLLLGNKATGEIFYQNDLETIPTIADQIAVAFENALGVQQISQFNKTLKDEVEKATQDLQKANDELKKLDNLKDEFLSMASHELKSPMNAVKNYLWMAMKKGGDSKEKMDLYLQTAYSATNRLVILVNDLLDVSRIESGRIKLDIKPIPLAQIIKETEDMYAPQAKEKGLGLITNVPADLTVKADDQKLREILNNFISNAIKYTPSGSVTVTAVKEQSKVKISVTDTGKGISTEDQQKLFQKFSRVNNSFKELAAIEGTGLGLWIAKQFVELMGGSIGVESTVNSGSTFWIMLESA